MSMGRKPAGSDYRYAELRSQRDLALQLNEHWILVQDDHKKRAEQLEAVFEKNDELEEKINQLQSERLNSKASS